MRTVGFLLSVVLWMSLASVAAAGKRHCTDGCSHCQAAPRVECQYRPVEKTILVPQVTLESRTVTVTRYRPDTRERVVPVSRLVPETKVVTRTCTVPEVKVGTRTVSYTVHHPVWKNVQQCYTVPVPYKKLVHGTRTVCRLEPVTLTRTVCEDRGHWEERPCPTPCPTADCRPCRKKCGECRGVGCDACPIPCVPQVKKVWVPNVVRREVPYTVMRPRYEQVPCDRYVTCFRPEERVRTVRVFSHTEPEVKSRQVNYTYYVPKTIEREVPITTYRCVTEEKVVPCTVMVPYQVEQQIQVPVCHMVPKTITCNVPSCDAGAPFCASCD